MAQEMLKEKSKQEVPLFQGWNKVRYWQRISCVLGSSLTFDLAL